MYKKILRTSALLLMGLSLVVTSCGGDKDPKTQPENDKDPKTPGDGNQPDKNPEQTPAPAEAVKKRMDALWTALSSNPWNKDFAAKFKVVSDKWEAAASGNHGSIAGPWSSSKEASLLNQVKMIKALNAALDTLSKQTANPATDETKAKAELDKLTTGLTPKATLAEIKAAAEAIHKLAELPSTKNNGTLVPVADYVNSLIDKAIYATEAQVKDADVDNTYKNYGNGGSGTGNADRKAEGPEQITVNQAEELRAYMQLLINFAK